MGNKVRNFIVKNATWLLGGANLIFFIFGIVILATSDIKSDDMSYYFATTMDVNANVDFMTFCGIATIVTSLVGLAIVFRPEYRKMLIVYMALILVLGFMQIIIGIYMRTRDCDLIEPGWRTTTAYYNRLRQDFKFNYKCCGFKVWHDDYYLDVDDLNYLSDSRVLADHTDGCYVNMNMPGTNVPCYQKCTEVFEDLTYGPVVGVLVVGVLELIAGGLVVLMILREKAVNDPTTSGFYFG